MTTLTATFNDDHGFVLLDARDVPAGWFLYRLSPQSPYGQAIPAFDYHEDHANQLASDYLAPLGTTITYGLKTGPDMSDTRAINKTSIVTPANKAYLRHLFYPYLSIRTRVLKFNDSRPSRLTTYAISGRRNAMATYDVRAGRDADLEIFLNGKAERDAFDEMIADGAPISLAFCSALGNNTGIFAIETVQYTRWGTRDQWVVAMSLVEVDMPVIVGHHDTGSDITGETYDEAKIVLGPTGTYDDAAAKWPRYYLAGIT